MPDHRCEGTVFTPSGQLERNRKEKSHLLMIAVVASVISLAWLLRTEARPCVVSLSLQQAETPVDDEFAQSEDAPEKKQRQGDRAEHEYDD